jgi:hypothetical protein
MIYQYPKSTVPMLSPEKQTLSAEEHYKMPLLTKIPNVKFDKDLLKKEAEDIAARYDPVFPFLPFNTGKHKYGGWSLTSATGDWRDGWETGSAMKDGMWNKDLAHKLGYKSKNGRFSQTIKTELYRGYLSEVVDTFKNLGFLPIAARIWTIPPGGYHIGPHTDAPVNMYSVRIHVPLLVNDQSIHIWFNDDTTTLFKTHIDATGDAYLFKTNTIHDAYNNHPSLPRYHLIMEGWDINHIVSGYEFNLNHLEKLKHYIKLDNPIIDENNILYGLL